MNNYHKIAILIFLIIFQICLFNRNKDYNFDRHATDLSYYAHFSKINKYNYFIFPKLLFTSPIHLELNAGDSLYIPKNMWHWVRTTDKSIAINFWYEKSRDFKDINKPIILKNQLNNWKINEKNYQDILKKETVKIWASNLDSDFKIDFTSFINDNKKDKYLITLPDFKVGENNKNIKERLKKFYDTPLFVKNNSLSNIDSNVWISSNFHDTGLHYDDFFGLLCVISGKKKNYIIS